MGIPLVKRTRRASSFVKGVLCISALMGYMVIAPSPALAQDYYCTTTTWMQYDASNEVISVAVNIGCSTEVDIEIEPGSVTNPSGYVVGGTDAADCEGMECAVNGVGDPQGSGPGTYDYNASYSTCEPGGVCYGPIPFGSWIDLESGCSTGADLGVNLSTVYYGGDVSCSKDVDASSFTTSLYQLNTYWSQIDSQGYSCQYKNTDCWYFPWTNPSTANDCYYSETDGSDTFLGVPETPPASDSGEVCTPS